MSYSWGHKIKVLLELIRHEYLLNLKHRINWCFNFWQQNGTNGFLLMLKRKLAEKKKNYFAASFIEHIEIIDSDYLVREKGLPLLRVAEKPIKNTSVSLVIPTLNAGASFDWILKNWRAQLGVQLEIIIIDSGSVDRTVKAAKQCADKVLKIPSKNFSHSLARNRAAELAQGDLLLFSTQDAYPPSNVWLSEFIAEFNKRQLTAASPSELTRQDSDLFYRYASDWYRNYQMQQVSSEQLSRQDKLAQSSLNNVCMLIKKDVFAKYQFKGNYAEDLQLGCDLQNNGYKIAVLSDIRIIHGHNRSPLYYLKRCLNDSLIKAKLMNETFEVNLNLRSDFFTFKNIFETIEHLFKDRIKLEKGSLTFLEFENRVKTAMSNLETTVLTVTTDEDVDSLGLKNFIVGFIELSSETQLNQSLIIESLRIQNEFLQYLKSIYSFVDANLLQEIALMYECGLAQQLGGYLGQVYFDPQTSQTIKNKISLLAKGV